MAASSSVFYSKTGRFIKGILKLAGKVVFKTSVDFNENSKEDHNFDKIPAAPADLLHQGPVFFQGVKAPSDEACLLYTSYTFRIPRWATDS